MDPNLGVQGNNACNTLLNVTLGGQVHHVDPSGRQFWLKRLDPSYIISAAHPTDFTEKGKNALF